ncbi:DNA helicase RecQ [Sulfuricurvum sp.]|uniref:DNA helicase RecQ n=1 Tax=Sulfuricurvum sp. TaxID=2025608 RepID=UPI0035619905
MGKKDEVLKRVFGHSSFRAFQEEAVDAIVAGSDVMMILPTGAGKSLCYQLPSLLMEGVTVVISPLLALMHDQITALGAFGIEAAMVSSMQTSEEITATMQLATVAKLKFLYVAPERLKSGEFIRFLRNIPLNFFVVDEAHCVSEWGHEFREDYRQLYRLRELFPNVPIAAFTATATHMVEHDILSQLRLREPVLIRAKVSRENLTIGALHRNGNGREQLMEFLSKYEHESGIVYTFTRKEAEELAKFLSTKKIPAQAYHAGLPSEQKNETYRAFLNDDIRVVVATVAFGMGIDKSNIRFVVHTSLPKTIENYYQEIGRAGRDGLDASTLLLFSASDFLERKRMIESQSDSPYKKLAFEKLEATAKFASSQVCRHRLIAEYFDDSATACGVRCDNCLEPDKESIDITQESLKLLSAVYRSGQRFGLHYVIDILLGSKNEKIEQNAHERLSVYGIGKDKSRRQWLSIGDRLMELGALAQGEFRVVAIDEYGLHILKNSLAVTIRKERLEEKQRGVKGRKTAYGSEENHTVFEQLRGLRTEIAKRSNVPPYVVFSDKTLQEMAAKLPQNRSEMLQIGGIGEVKFDRYGEAFLELCLFIQTGTI